MVILGKIEFRWGGIFIRIVFKEGWLVRRNRKFKRTVGYGEVIEVF